MALQNNGISLFIYHAKWQGVKFLIICKINGRKGVIFFFFYLPLEHYFVILYACYNVLQTDLIKYDIFLLMAIDWTLEHLYDWVYVRKLGNEEMN
jgi:hypothetical protein